MNNKVLVLGSDTRSFLAVIRSLGRQGYEVHTAWASSDSPALFSRYIKFNHQVPMYQSNNNEWIDDFEQILLSEKIDLIIPCSEPTMIPLQLVRKRLERHSLIYLPPDEVLDITLNKDKSYDIVRGLDIPVAKSITVKNESEVLHALNTIPAPWVFKPISSFSVENTTEVNTVEKAFTRNHADLLSRKFLQKGPFQIQENFIGYGTGVEVLCCEGELLLVFQHLRVHEPLHGGGSSYRRGIPVHAGMLSATKKIMQQLRYTGVAMVEYKWNQTNDTWIFIEINSRFWGSLPLALVSGADFPVALTKLLLSGRRHFPYTIKTHLYSRNVAQDLDWLLANAKADRKDPCLASRRWHIVMKEAFNIISGRERWDTLTPDDPVPFFIEVMNYITSKLDSVKRKTRYYVTHHQVARYFRKKKLIYCLNDAKLIGFICYGNICRSPFAEMAAIHSRLRLDVYSAGFHEKEGRLPPCEAVEAAEHFGVNIQHHKSLKITEEYVRKTDIIFVFDQSNYDQLVGNFPYIKEKIFWLSDIRSDIPAVIADPYGQSLSIFDNTFKLIHDCIDKLVVLRDKSIIRG